MFNFNGPATAGREKAKKLQKKERCIICHYRLSQTAVMVWSQEKEDISSIECNRCRTIYSLTFEVLRISNDRLIKVD